MRRALPFAFQLRMLHLSGWGERAPENRENLTDARILWRARRAAFRALQLDHAPLSANWIAGEAKEGWDEPIIIPLSNSHLNCI